jgi:hypothetical protein
MSVAETLRRHAPRSLTGRVTLAAVAAVGVALALAGTGVVIAAGRADRSALDRELNRLVTRLDRPAELFVGPGVRGMRFRHGPRLAPPAGAAAPSAGRGAGTP